MNGVISFDLKTFDIFIGASLIPVFFFFIIATAVSITLPPRQFAAVLAAAEHFLCS